MLLWKNLFSGHQLRRTPSSVLMKLFCSTQACTNLSNNMQMKNNTVSNLELLNKLATAFSRPCLQGEKAERQIALVGLGLHVTGVGGLEGECCLSPCPTLRGGRASGQGCRQQRKMDVAPAEWTQSGGAAGDACPISQPAGTLLAGLEQQHLNTALGLKGPSESPG